MIRRLIAALYGLALGWVAFLSALLVFGVLVFATGSARAEPFATVTAGQSTVTLRTDQGPCVGQARLALFTVDGSSEAPIPGCWVLDGDLVRVSWLDGDRGNIPAAQFVKVRAL